jgi:hypothetical protein
MTTSAATIDRRLRWARADLHPTFLGPCRPASDIPAAGFGEPVLGAVTPVDAFKPCIEVQSEHNISPHALQTDRGRGRGCVGEKEESGREGERGITEIHR